MKRKALLTGITGQDGSYLAELLLSNGYEVHGIKRRSSSFNTGRVNHLLRDLHERDSDFILHFGDMTDLPSLMHLLENIAPDEVYNLAAQSHVAVSFETPEYTANADAVGTLRILEAIRLLGLGKSVRFYQASTSELFGGYPDTIPQNEETSFHPRSPYGVAKLYAHWIVTNYREAYDIHASNGILFNHESPRRGETFVTRKITMAAARIWAGEQKRLYLGNLNAARDWGYAPDYVKGMWMMLQQEAPDDYVLATGEMHTVREFCEQSFLQTGFHLTWIGKGIEEKGIDQDSGKILVEVDPRYYRPAEVDALCGNPAKARRKLGWEPAVTFGELVRIMTRADMENLSVRPKGDQA